MLLASTQIFDQTKQLKYFGKFVDFARQYFLNILESYKNKWVAPGIKQIVEMDFDV